MSEIDILRKMQKFRATDHFHITSEASFSWKTSSRSLQRSGNFLCAF